MYYDEKFENGQWWHRTIPDGEWFPGRREPEIGSAARITTV